MKVLQAVTIAILMVLSGTAIACRDLDGPLTVQIVDSETVVFGRITGTRSAGMEKIGSAEANARSAYLDSNVGGASGLSEIEIRLFVTKPLKNGRLGILILKFDPCNRPYGNVSPGERMIAYRLHGRWHALIGDKDIEEAATALHQTLPGLPMDPPQKEP